jgi:hypothetical protein
MNDRIRELIREAESTTNEGIGFEGQEYLDMLMERFAELIVKECMTMSDELKAQYLTSRKSTMDFDEKNIYAEGEAACDVLKYKMKKHFGVEE